MMERWGGMSGDDHRIRTERVTYGGRSFRICSQTRPERSEIATTLELGEMLLMSKSAPYNATLEPDVIDQALDSENRIVRERLLAGDLDAWLESPESSAEPTMPSVYTSSAPPPRRKPGRWAVKVGMVESP